MAPVLEVSSGGAFLIRSLNPDELFTPEDLTDEQRLFGRTAAEFMRNEVLPNEASLYAHDWAKTRELLKKAADLDLLRLEIPEAYGGLGLDKVSAAYVGESLALNPSFGGSLGAHTSIGTLPLVYFGTPEQKAKYLPRVGSGELIGAYALTEPHSGSDALSARTTARLTADGTHYLLNGQKAWITNGGFADVSGADLVETQAAVVRRNLEAQQVEIGGFLQQLACLRPVVRVEAGFVREHLVAHELGGGPAEQPLLVGQVLGRELVIRGQRTYQERSAARHFQYGCHSSSGLTG